MTTFAGIVFTTKELEAIVELSLIFYRSEEQLRDAIAWHILDRMNNEHFPELKKLHDKRSLEETP